MSLAVAQPKLSRSEIAYLFLTCSFVAILILTNIIGTKLFVFLPKSLPNGLWGIALILTSGIITYPFTFLLTDIVSEIWGKQRADLMVVIGFLLSLLVLLIIGLAKALPPADVWQIQANKAEFFHPDHYIHGSSGAITSIDSAAAQAAFSFAFDAHGLLIFSSMLAYLIAQLLDNFLFHFWRRLTKGRHLWLRNNGSTFISQLLDSFIVNGIFLSFYWGMPWFYATSEKPVTIIQVILLSYTAKIIIAFLDTPLIYGGVYFLRKKYLIRSKKI